MSKNFDSSNETVEERNFYSERNIVEGPIPFFSVYKYGKTYLNLIYLFLTFPLGIAFFVYSVTLFSVSVGLIFTFVGIILLYAFLWSLPRIMYLQGVFTEVLVGIKMPPGIYKPSIEGNFVTKALNALKDKRILKTSIFITNHSPSSALTQVFIFPEKIKKGSPRRWRGDPF